MSNTQKTTNLFQSVKSFINTKKPSEVFTTRELTAAMKGIESVTTWKKVCNNPFYRTQTYRTYLKRLGFIEMIKRGEWKVIANIPEWLDSGHINFLLFNQYPNLNMTGSTQVYGGESKDQIKEKINQAITKPTINTDKKMGYGIGDTVRIISFDGGTTNSLEDIGVITEFYTELNNGFLVRVQVEGKLDYANWSNVDRIELIKRADEPVKETNSSVITETLVSKKMPEVIEEQQPIQNQDLYIYIVEVPQGRVEFYASDFTIHKDLDSAKARYIDLLKCNIFAKVYKTEFDSQCAREEIIEVLSQQDIKNLASEIVGDGGNNLWFVTESSYIKIEDEDGNIEDCEILDSYEDTPSTTYGPYTSYKSACEAYDDIELSADDGIGQVTIEDRQIGVVKEKFLRKQVVTQFVEDEYDDSYFYGK